MFIPTNYYVYLRVGSFGGTEAELSRVLGPLGQSNQFVVPLGRFLISNHLMRTHYRYVPLTHAGHPVTVQLAGQETLRLTMLGIAGQDAGKVYLNYLLFVPVFTSPEPAVLSIRREANRVVLSWPAGPWRLLRSAGLNSSPWVEVTEGMVEAGGQRSLSVVPTEPAFYRLVAL